MSVLQPSLILAAAAVLVAATAVLDAQSAPEALPPPVVPEIGAPVHGGDVHVIQRPGLYGIADPAPGMQYAVVGSSLVRIDTASNVVRSIIRGGVRPVD